MIWNPVQAGVFFMQRLSMRVKLIVFALLLLLPLVLVGWMLASKVWSEYETAAAEVQGVRRIAALSRARSFWFMANPIV